MSTPPADLTLREVGDLIRARDLSPVEVLAASLTRIEAVDPELSAFISVAGSSARAAAAAAEAEIRRGEYRGPLHGVPLGLKDNIAVAGEPCRAGSKVIGEQPAPSDSTVAAGLREAGAVVVGRLNMDELAAGITTDNPHYGTTRNPWDTDRSPGGSSGGAGAATAARMVFGAIGTDTGCSVRIPAAFNGITGLRPTIGRVSNHGIVPLAWTLDTVGPLCRTADDCGLLLDAIAGYDPSDPQSAAQQGPEWIAADGNLEGVRLALIDDFSFVGVDQRVKSLLEDALVGLEALGAEVTTVSIADLDLALSALLTINLVEPSADHAGRLREQPDDYGDDVRLLFETGQLYLASHYVQAQRYRGLLRARLLAELAGVDALAMPTAPFAAPPIGADSVPLKGSEELSVLVGAVRFNALASLGGLPSISLPCGFVEEMPIGMQLVGRPFAETDLLRIGSAFQLLTAWHRQAPSI
jgi:aspartyl-tRNA(Asn)/glutamyl-tRNA(Gln) amidotransferase subunit A